MTKKQLSGRKSGRAAQLVKKVQKDFFDKLPTKLQNQYL